MNKTEYNATDAVTHFPQALAPAATEVEAAGVVELTDSQLDQVSGGSFGIQRG